MVSKKIHKHKRVSKNNKLRKKGLKVEYLKGWCPSDWKDKSVG